MNPFDQFKNEGDEIVSATQQIHKIIDTALEENYFSPEELECVSRQMQDLTRQGLFWLERENRERFIYDLKNFIKWLVQFVETRKNEQGE